MDIRFGILLDLKCLSYCVPHTEAGSVAAEARRCNIIELSGSTEREMGRTEQRRLLEM